MIDDGAALPRANRLTRLLLYTGVVLLALVPNNLLEWIGIPYDTPGGSVLFKLHPATYALVLAYLSLGLSGNVARGLAEGLGRLPATSFFVLTTSLTMIYLTLRFSPSGVAFVIDTLLLPALLVLLLRHFDDRARRQAFVLMAVLLAINAAVAIGEAATSSRVLPYLIGGKRTIEDHFRATAFGGHPLSNALVTATYGFAAVVLLRHRRWRPAVVLAMLLYGLALLAFGGRAAFVVAVGVGGLWLAAYLVRTSFTKESSPGRALGTIIVLLAMPVLGLIMMQVFHLGGRIFAEFSFDASAQARVSAFDALSDIDSFDLIFGIGPEGVADTIRLLHYTSGLDATIENFWLLWALEFGVVCVVPLVATFLWFLVSLLRGAPPALWIAAGAFLLIASGNNSLASKDRSLSFLVIALVGGAAAAREVSLHPRPVQAASQGAGFQYGRATALALAGGLTLAAFGGACAARAGETPTLARGVALSHWLQYDGRQPITPADLAQIKAQGFDHVRIPFDPLQIGWSAGLGDRAPARIDRLDHAVDLVLGAGLTAILDFHPEDAVEKTLENDEAARRSFVGFWHQAAIRYRNRPTGSLVFELLNEPAFYGFNATADWEALERSALGEIRTVDPDRLVLFANNHADEAGEDDLREPREAADDPHVGYVFHLYSPHIFTEFDAPWDEHGRPPYTLIERMLYPASAMATLGFPVRPGPEHDRAVRLVRQYVEENWGPARLEAQVAQLAAWAEAHKTHLFATEFGVYRPYVDPTSRLAWLRDARQAFERHHIPWTVWDYADVCGIATAVGNIRLYDDGSIVPGDPGNPRRRFDPAALAALGMDAPR